MGIKIGPRDAQQKTVYCNEQEIFWDLWMFDRHNTFNEAQDYVNSLWEAADVPEGVPAPRVTENARLSRSAYYHGLNHTIQTNHNTLSGRGMSYGVFVHETAHAVMNANGLLHTTEWHGPEFVSVMCDLAARHHDPTDAKAAFRNVGVRVLDHVDFSELGKGFWRFDLRGQNQRLMHRGNPNVLFDTLKDSGVPKGALDGHKHTTPAAFFEALLNE